MEFANEVLTPAGETVDRSAPKKLRAEVRVEQAEAFRKSGSGWGRRLGTYDARVSEPLVLLLNFPPSRSVAVLFRNPLYKITIT